MQSREQDQLPVLVVGAGPSGLTMAAELVRHGVACRIVDKAEAPTALSKATGMQARTLEVFDDIGVVDEIMAHGHVAHGVNLYAGGKRVMHFRYDDIDTPYPFMLNIVQGETERILGNLVDRLGVPVERQVELVGFTQDDHGVTATLRHADGHEETVAASWLIGCDGAHSTVRHTLNIPFEGHTYDEWFALADAKLHWSLPDDELHGFIHPKGVFFVIPLRDGHHRLIVEDAEHTGNADPTLADFQAALDERGPGNATISDPGWIAGFRVNVRRAAKYRVGRAFMAGEACHVHSPAGGQGLNTSVQDTYNLAWKLALVIKGQAPVGLLDSYEAERAPVADAVLRMTNVLTRVLTLHNALAQGIRNRLMPLLGGSQAMQHRLATQDAEIDVTYRKSPIVDEHHGGRFSRSRFAGGPAAGDRAPDAGPLLRSDGSSAQLYDLLRGTPHVLLLFGGEEPAAATWNNLQELARSVQGYAGERIRTYLVADGASVPEGLTETDSLIRDQDGALHHRYQADTPCLYLIRPDGYVGFRSRPADGGALRAYLERIFVV